MDKSSFGRKDRLVKERRHDSYHSRTKLPDPMVCTECGVVYLKGRWVWNTVPEGASPSLCPACRRIADRFPAGQIAMKGSFFAEHRDEVLNLVRNVEGREKANHPMERIMSIAEEPGGVVVSTTGVHLARGIGAALASAYNGETSVKYLNGENYVQVNWTR